MVWKIHSIQLTWNTHICQFDFRAQPYFCILIFGGDYVNVPSSMLLIYVAFIYTFQKRKTKNKNVFVHEILCDLFTFFMLIYLHVYFFSSFGWISKYNENSVKILLTIVIILFIDTDNKPVNIVEYLSSQWRSQTSCGWCSSWTIVQLHWWKRSDFDYVDSIVFYWICHTSSMSSLRQWLD